MMLPVTPAPNVPPEYVRRVPRPVLIQPVPPTVPTGDQTIVVPPTVTPPPLQLDSLKLPTASAEAAGIRLKKASAPTAANRHPLVRSLPDDKLTRSNCVSIAPFSSLTATVL